MHHFPLQFQPPAESKPFVKCPAAMECTPREYCDLEGFISEQPLQLTQQLEMLRVSVIVSKNGRFLKKRRKSIFYFCMENRLA